MTCQRVGEILLVLKCVKKIKKCLLKADYLNKYRITQIKEKFGELFVGMIMVFPSSISDEFDSIINYYEDKSMLVCIHCGKPTKYIITSGWVEYICEEHFKEHLLQYPRQIITPELTWSNIPVRCIHYSDKEIKVESGLKGDMMCTWKRYSKYNVNKLKQILDNIKRG